MKYLSFANFKIKAIDFQNFINRVKYVEQELAKKRGRTIESMDQVENELKRAEDELYKIPDHLKVTLDQIQIFYVSHINVYSLFHYLWTKWV